ncbi:hypothetical protein [Clostridium thermarum]|uniref:hypothetical protein n=1 Tax=Clostridium thermarum TaxID=1716543 RepID=UPI00111E1401|nr:hypothetical protein [Clostridium thermarum]
MASVSNSLKNAPSYVQQSYKNSTTQNQSTSKSNTAKDVAKGGSVAIQQNPLKGTNYQVITTPKSSSGKSTTTVLNIVDKSLGKTSNSNGVPKGDWVFIVDSPHGNTNYNHVNTNSKLYPDNKIYQSLNHKPVSNTVYNAAKNMDDIAKVAKVGGRAVAVAAVVMDGKDIYDSYKADGNKVGKNTVTTTAGVAGSWAGGVGGAKVGAMGGVSIGTMICPGIGTAIGGVVGGLIGGIAGSLGGRVAGQEIAKAAYK